MPPHQNPAKAYQVDKLSIQCPTAPNGPFASSPPSKNNAASKSATGSDSPHPPAPMPSGKWSSNTPAKKESRNMNSDFKDLLRLFGAHSVRYLVVGGYAVSHHAQPRFTKDLDLWIEPDCANRRCSSGIWNTPHRSHRIRLRPGRIAVLHRHAPEPARFPHYRSGTPIHRMLAHKNPSRNRRHFSPLPFQACPHHRQENRRPRPRLGRPRRTPTTYRR